MTTHSINDTKAAHITQADQQAKSRSAEHKKEAVKKDIVELSNRPNEEVTYSRESITAAGTSAHSAKNFDAVHDLRQVKENIEMGVYDREDVIDTVVDRMMDELE